MARDVDLLPHRPDDAGIRDPTTSMSASREALTSSSAASPGGHAQGHLRHRLVDFARDLVHESLDRHPRELRVRAVHPDDDCRHFWSSDSRSVPTTAGPEDGSAHPAGDVGLGALLAWVLEDLLGPAVLDEHACAGVALAVSEYGEEGGTVADPRGLLHVVRDDDDGVPRLELLHQILDGACRDWVERRGGLVHKDD